QVAQGLKFCGECGSPMQKSYKCSGCGFENPPGTKFCGQCGTKL
ncbi:MAG: zinc ribbon domain-containing protein, partial [Eubacterium sp.]|nr:zinc ribbon domain-containing protein [Eubacterium sp.]